MSVEFRDNMRAIVLDLCNPNAPEFLRMMRLYQLKQWLVWDLDDVLCFKDAAAQFTIISLTRYVNRASMRPTNRSPSQLLVKALKSDEYAKIFDISFGKDFRRGAFLYGLYYDLALGRHNEVVKSSDAARISLKYFTELQLRVNATPELKKTQDNALEAYKLTYDEDDTTVSERTLRKNLKSRRLRTPFLFVGERYPWVEELAKSRIKVWRILKEQICRTDDFKTYFSECSGIANALSHSDKDLSHELQISKWLKTDSIKPNVPGFTSEELRRLGLKRGK